jgi:glycosyltransferase involved in cell wall biosynthesis
MGLHPRIVPDPQRLKSATPPAVHVAFRSAENLRLVSGARNICHFAWEFDVLRDGQLPSKPILGDQVHMLGLFDEIWAPSTYTRDILHAHGLDRAELVPTPVCEASPAPRLVVTEILDRIGDVPLAELCFSSAASEAENLRLVGARQHQLAKVPAVLDRLAGGEGRIFLTVCNPHDLRKNLLNAIDGFRMAKRPGDVLIIKLIVPNEGDHLTTAQHRHVGRLFWGPAALADRDVLFLTHYLEWPQMEALYSLADFYLSASYCEGFNLPLLEAMSFGCIPVSTRVTAMTDYVSDRNAVVIATRRYTGHLPGMAGDVAGRAYALDVASRLDIGRAVRRALELPNGEAAVRAADVRTIVSELYSFEAVARRVRDRFAAHAVLPESLDARHG